MASSMRAMAADDGTLRMIEIAIPEPGPGDVRVRVVASTINPAVQRVIAGDFVGRFLHARTKPLVVGWEFSGTIDALGAGVSDIEPGTPVWGHLPYSGSSKQGAFAEYITLPRDDVAVKPDDIPHHVAAAAATDAMTSLQALRDLGSLNDGGTALIIGAGGGVGSVGIGIAKRLGARVTGVCSTKDLERVASFGADAVIDRNKEDPLAARGAYDVIFDTPAVHSFGKCSKALRPRGTYVTTLPGLALITGMLRALATSKRCRFVTVESRRADLELVGRWLSDGLVTPIDSRHKIADLTVALQRQTDRSRSGRVVVDVGDGWK